MDQRRILQLLTLIKKSTIENKLELVDHDRETRHNDGLKLKLPIYIYPKSNMSDTLLFMLDAGIAYLCMLELLIF